MKTVLNIPITGRSVKTRNGMVILLIAGLLVTGGVTIVRLKLGVRTPVKVMKNNTYIEKTNRQWPLKNAVSIDPCRSEQCFDI